jgi:transcriptional regulator with XRE-family HTH domain
MAKLEFEIENTTLKSLSNYRKQMKIKSINDIADDIINFYINRPLTTTEAAEFAGVHPCTILRWEKAGKLYALRPALRTSPGMRRFSVTDIQKTLSWRKYWKRKKKEYLPDRDQILMGHSIRDCRKRLGMELRGAARKAGDTVTRLRNIEKGKHKLQKKTLEKYARSWGVTIQDLMPSKELMNLSKKHSYEFWIPKNRTRELDQKDWDIVKLLRKDIRPLEISKKVRLTLESTKKRIRRIISIADIATF